MKNRITIKTALTLFASLLAVVLLSTMLLLHALAEETVFSGLKSCKDQTGYQSPGALSSNNPLVGVEVAEIRLSGFSKKLIKDGKTYLLRTSPDAISFSLNFLQSITTCELYADGDVSVPDFNYRGRIGKGLLCFEHVDHQGKTTRRFISDVFNGKDSDLAKIATLDEEGDYRIALLFETRKKVGSHRKWDNPFHYHWVDDYDYYNYRLDAVFSIRNANTMVYVFENQNRNEVLNGARVFGGFTIDYANSHYLNVTIKREINISNELATTDVRSNTVGADLRSYDEPGVYTITVKNPLLDTVTTKVFLVAESGGLSQDLEKLAEETYPEVFGAPEAETVSLLQPITKGLDLQKLFPYMITAACVLGLVFLFIILRKIFGKKSSM